MKLDYYHNIDIQLLPFKRAFTNNFISRITIRIKKINEGGTVRSVASGF